MEATALFDLYYLLVEQLFGSIWLAGIGLLILFGVMGIVSRMSPVTLIMLLGFFVGVYTIGIFGELLIIPLFIISFMYFIIGAGRFIMKRMEAF